LLICYYGFIATENQGFYQSLHLTEKGTNEQNKLTFADRNIHYLHYFKGINHWFLLNE